MTLHVIFPALPTSPPCRKTYNKMPKKRKFGIASSRNLEKARKKKKAGKQCLHQENKHSLKAAVTASDFWSIRSP